MHCLTFSFVMMQHSTISFQEGDYLAVLVPHSIHDGAAIVPAVYMIHHCQCTTWGTPVCSSRPKTDASTCVFKQAKVRCKHLCVQASQRQTQAQQLTDLLNILQNFCATAHILFTHGRLMPSCPQLHCHIKCKTTSLGSVVRGATDLSRTFMLAP